MYTYLQNMYHCRSIDVCNQQDGVLSINLGRDFTFFLAISGEHWILGYFGVFNMVEQLKSQNQRLDVGRRPGVTISLDGRCINSNDTAAAGFSCLSALHRMKPPVDLWPCVSPRLAGCPGNRKLAPLTWI